MNNNKKISIMLMLISNFIAGSASAHNIQVGEYHHNTAEIDLSTGFFNKKKLDIEIRIPAQDAYGFEGKSTNLEQEEKVNAIIDNLKQNISEVIALPSDANCKYEVNNINKFDISSEKYEEAHKGEKTNVKTTYWNLTLDASAYCNRSLYNEKVIIDLSKHFKNINKIIISLNTSKNRKFTLNKISGEFYL
ncbi:ZrgA family zinc uptake protein [Silvanigrella aquatica]|uniref:DUF2796 domain-containing protein n=1 Tax=Silvanigrella aquatica TaxID=1915309 RepID=A0A1L4D3J1_9BACT|nr:DUF2796 domain-containing protein [Silvanigrella aquatica]APJ04785.1 hypothetical protein AXG55_13110 [Silvanigrella aquatica]